MGDWFWTWVYPVLIVTVPATIISVVTVIVSAEWRARLDSKKICPHCGVPWSAHKDQ